jgi:hypothetical protein
MFKSKFIGTILIFESNEKGIKQGERMLAY